jgi:branched-chain amino acid transport system permease protein
VQDHETRSIRVRHAVRATIGALLAALCVLLLPGAASAQDATPTPAATPAAGTGETLQGRLANAGEPVEGATITVTTADGQEVGEAETDETGAFSIPVPGPGDYTIALDEDSLPEGVTIREGRSSEVTLPVAEGQQRAVLFPLGEGTRNVQSRLDRLPGLAVEGLQFGLIIALAAVGLSLIYGTTGLTNFAHGELVTLGAATAGCPSSSPPSSRWSSQARSAACRTGCCGGRCAGAAPGSSPCSS